MFNSQRQFRGVRGADFAPGAEKKGDDDKKGFTVDFVTGSTAEYRKFRWVKGQGKGSYTYLRFLPIRAEDPSQGAWAPTYLDREALELHDWIVPCRMFAGGDRRFVNFISTWSTDRNDPSYFDLPPVVLKNAVEKAKKADEHPEWHHLVARDQVGEDGKQQFGASLPYLDDKYLFRALCYKMGLGGNPEDLPALPQGLGPDDKIPIWSFGRATVRTLMSALNLSGKEECASLSSGSLYLVHRNGDIPGDMFTQPAAGYVVQRVPYGSVDPRDIPFPQDVVFPLDLTPYQQLLYNKLTPWEETIKCSSIDEQVALLAKAFKYDVLEYAFGSRPAWMAIVRDVQATEGVGPVTTAQPPAASGGWHGQAPVAAPQPQPVFQPQTQPAFQPPPAPMFQPQPAQPAPAFQPPAQPWQPTVTSPVTPAAPQPSAAATAAAIPTAWNPAATQPAAPQPSAPWMPTVPAPPAQPPGGAMDALAAARARFATSGAK